MSGNTPNHLPPRKEHLKNHGPANNFKKNQRFSRRQALLHMFQPVLKNKIIFEYVETYCK